ncbi:MAG: SNF2-related protein, partial [Gammaproteobacteria bacterium]
KLKALGWEIVIERSFPIEYIVEIEDWYTNVVETTEYNWFDLELGFVVDDQKINILPLLIELIKKDPKIFNEQFFNNNLEKNQLLNLANGQKVNIPVKRLQGIFAVLSELYDLNSLNKSGQLAVSRLRAAQILELEKAMATTKLRWYGATKLQELSKKLVNFKSITPIKVPSIFKGTLRGYQQEGVNWLGFLREYQFGGILSDDMGLGKTVQALAHLAVEKKAKRLNNACLIVAPTTLL